MIKTALSALALSVVMLASLRAPAANADVNCNELRRVAGQMVSSGAPDLPGQAGDLMDSSGHARPWVAFHPAVIGEAVDWPPIWTWEERRLDAAARVLERCAKTVDQWGTPGAYSFHEAWAKRLRAAKTLIADFWTQVERAKAARAEIEDELDLEAALQPPMTPEHAVHMLALAEKVLNASDDVGKKYAETWRDRYIKHINTEAESINARLRQRYVPHTVDLAEYAELTAKVDDWETKVGAAFEGIHAYYTGILKPRPFDMQDDFTDFRYAYAEHLAGEAAEAARSQAPIKTYLDFARRTAPEIARKVGDVDPALHKSTVYNLKDVRDHLRKEGLHDACMTALDNADMGAQESAEIHTSDRIQIPHPTLDWWVCYLGHGGMTVEYAHGDRPTVTIRPNDPELDFGNLDAFDEITITLANLPDDGTPHYRGVRVARDGETRELGLDDWTQLRLDLRSVRFDIPHL